MPLSLKHLRTGHFEFSLMSLMILVVVISAQNGVSFLSVSREFGYETYRIRSVAERTSRSDTSHFSFSCVENRCRVLSISPKGECVRFPAVSLMTLRCGF